MLTTTRALVTRVLRPLLKAAEGQPRGGGRFIAELAVLPEGRHLIDQPSCASMSTRRAFVSSPFTSDGKPGDDINLRTLFEHYHAEANS